MIDWEREQELLRVLVRQRHLTADQAREVYQEGVRTDQSAVALALTKGYVAQEQVDEVRGAPIHEIASLRDIEIDPSVLSLIPRDMGRRLRAFPVRVGRTGDRAVGKFRHH